MVSVTIPVESEDIWTPTVMKYKNTRGGGMIVISRKIASKYQLEDRDQIEVAFIRKTGNTVPKREHLFVKKEGIASQPISIPKPALAKPIVQPVVAPQPKVTSEDDIIINQLRRELNTRCRPVVLEEGVEKLSNPGVLPIELHQELVRLKIGGV